MPDLDRAPSYAEFSLLGGRVELRVPDGGLKPGTDAVMLAAAIPAKAGEFIFEAGTGAGPAALCLAARVPGCRISGLEIQQDLAKCAADNAALNDAADQVRIFAGDISDPPSDLKDGALGPNMYHHVMMNPPFLEAGAAGKTSDDRSRQIATVEGAADLPKWISYGLKMARPGGTITLIHRADRLDAIVAALGGRAGGVTVFPLWPDARDKPAKRVLVQARKGGRAPATIARGMVMHGEDGAYSPAAESILRDGAALDLSQVGSGPLLA